MSDSPATPNSGGSSSKVTQVVEHTGKMAGSMIDRSVGLVKNIGGMA